MNPNPKIPSIGQRDFVTQFAVDGVGLLTVAGRHAGAFTTAIKSRQPFIRLDDGDSTIVIPTALVRLVTEGEAKELPSPEGTPEAAKIAEEMLGE